jgi:integrase
MAIIKRGENTYLVRVYIERDPITGQRKEFNITVRGTPAVARKVEAKLKGEKESERIVKISSVTLAALIDLYSESVRHTQAKSTQEKNRAYFYYYVRPYIGTMPLKRIDTSMIQNLFNFLLDKKKVIGDGKKIAQVGGGRGLSPTTVKSVKKVLAAAFNFAVKQKLIAENPVRNTKLPRTAATAADSFTLKEAQAFSAVKEKFWHGYAFVFQLHTGLRPQELMALVWEDIDFEQGTLRVERACNWIRGRFTGFGPPKCKRSERVIGLAPEHLELLKIHLTRQQENIEGRKARGEAYGESKIQDWVMEKRPKQLHLYVSARLIFPNPDGQVSNYATLNTEFKEMLRCAGIQKGRTNYRWYDLRHTHATHLLILREPDHEVAKRMGHSVAMLQTTYAHCLEDRRSVAANVFVKHLPIVMPSNQPQTEGNEGKVLQADTSEEYAEKGVQGTLWDQ